MNEHLAQRTRRRLTAAGLVMVATLLLGCGTLTALPITNSPRWACPSVTPLPTKVKEVRPLPTPTPGVEDVYYEMWEQEYGLPVQTPTPYAREGKSYYFGQRVEVRPVYALVTAAADARVGDSQLYMVTIKWLNRAAGPLEMDYATRVRLTAVRTDEGRVLTGTTWGVTRAALDAAGIDDLPVEIPLGESEVRVPVLAPPGRPETVSVEFSMSSAATPSQPPSLPDHGPPQRLTIHWSQGTTEPPCDDAGVITDWGDGPPPLPEAPNGPVAVRVVQIALNQVGKAYVWGAKGPNTFDCSGLMQWSYAQVGVRIPAGTGGQWPGLPPVEFPEAQPGDLIFFDSFNTGQITHVGMLTGDRDGDGTWDMVHAVSPQLGIREDYRIMQSAYYRSIYRGLRMVVRSTADP